METVTLSKQEYDRLKESERQFNVMKDTPSEFIKFRITTYGYNGKENTDEFEIMSGEDSFKSLESRLKYKYENAIDQMKQKVEVCEKALKEVKTLKLLADKLYIPYEL